MSNRDVQEQILLGFEAVAERFGVPRSKSRACALQLVTVVTGHGIRLARPANIHDPAADWRNKPAAADPLAGANQVRAALYGTGQCPLCRTWPALTGAGTLADHLVTDADGITSDCLGAGLEPVRPQPPAPRTHP